MALFMGLLLLLCGSENMATARQTFSTPLINITVYPANGSTITLYKNNSIKMQFYFLGASHHEDTFHSNITTTYKNGTSTRCRDPISENEGIVEFDEDSPYQKLYWTSGLLGKLFEVVVTNHEEFKDIERVRVRVVYSYNYQSSSKGFVVDALFENTSSPTVTENNETLCSKENTSVEENKVTESQPRLSNNNSVAENKITESPPRLRSTAVGLGVVLALVVVVGCLALVATIVAILKMNKRVNLKTSNTPEKHECTLQQSPSNSQQPLAVAVEVTPIAGPQQYPEAPSSSRANFSTLDQQD